MAGGVPASGANTARDTGYKVDANEFFLLPGRRVEYKYRLEQGAVMVYSWKADATVNFDMHTLPDGQPPSASQSFMTGDGNELHGVYTAPYAGLHGWYWENRGTADVMISVTAAGFFTEAVMFADGEQVPFPVQDPPGLAALSK